MRVPLSIFISITILNACACFSLYLCTIFSYFVNKFFYYDARLEATIATIDLEASFWSSSESSDIEYRENARIHKSDIIASTWHITRDRK